MSDLEEMSAFQRKEFGMKRTEDEQNKRGISLKAVMLVLDYGTAKNILSNDDPYWDREAQAESELFDYIASLELEVERLRRLEQKGSENEKKKF